MNAYECYVLYVALKNHFKQKSYDFFKYNGKIRSNPQSFSTRGDKVFFEKLAKHENPRDFLVSNLIENEKIWIRDIAYSEEAENTYKNWQKRLQSLSYHIKSDLSNLKDNFNDNFIVEEYDHPHLLKLYLRKDISLETLVILTDLTGCVKSWDKKMVDDPVWDKVRMKIMKYRPFIKYDMEKIKETIVYKFS